MAATVSLAVLAAGCAGDARNPAFAGLSGPARRLAIYDAFTEALERHIYDRHALGPDWPAQKLKWRARAAGEPSDSAVYFDALWQLSETLPVSHVGAVPPAESARAPSSGSAAPPQPIFTWRDPGFTPAEIRRQKGVAMIVGEVLPGSPAAEAGVQPGSLIETMDLRANHVTATLFCLTPEESWRLETLGETSAARSMRACQTGASPRVMKIDYGFRDEPSPAPVEARRLPTGALYIRFERFAAPQIEEVRRALRSADSRGVVLDLRFNQGGHVLPVLATLVGGGEPVFRYIDAHGLHLVRTPRETRPYAGSLVVLIGPNSASASEVVAAVVQARGRGRLVGRPTQGSVLGVRAFPLPDGGSADVPVEDLRTLDNRRLESVGVTPDIAVYPGVAELRRGEDPALARAEAALSSR